MSQFVSPFNCADEALYGKAKLALSEVKLLGLIRNTSSGAFTLRNAKGIRECTSAGDPRGKRGIELPCICNSYVCLCRSASRRCFLQESRFAQRCRCTFTTPGVPPRDLIHIHTQSWQLLGIHIVQTISYYLWPKTVCARRHLLHRAILVGCIHNSCPGNAIRAC